MTQQEVLSAGLDLGVDMEPAEDEGQTLPEHKDPQLQQQLYEVPLLYIP